MGKKTRTVRISPDPGKDDLADYRKWLVDAEQKSQESFDKTVLSLSGGALAISLVFVEDVIGTKTIVEPEFLLASWLCWAASSLAMLTSFMFSRKALRRAIEQVDSKTIRAESPGGLFARLTSYLNTAGALLFVLGLCSMTFFVNYNLSIKGDSNVQENSNVTAPAPAQPTKSAATAAPGQAKP